MNTAIHPVMAAALAPFAPKSSNVHALASEYAVGLYRKALEKFNWQFEHAEEHAVWARGSNDLANLRRMQRDIDPDGSIWMSYPGAHTHGAPQPIVREGGAA